MIPRRCKKASSNWPTRTISLVFNSLATRASGRCAVHQSDGQFSAGQDHGKVFDAATLREKFGLAGKGKADLVHTRLVDGTSYDGLEPAVTGLRDCFLESVSGGTGRFGGWSA